MRPTALLAMVLAASTVVELADEMPLSPLDGVDVPMLLFPAITDTRVDEDATVAVSTQGDESSAIDDNLRSGVIEDLGCFGEGDGDGIRAAIKRDDAALRHSGNKRCGCAACRSSAAYHRGGVGNILQSSARRDGALRRHVRPVQELDRLEAVTENLLGKTNSGNGQEAQGDGRQL